MITLRPFDEETDYPRLVAVSNLWGDEPTSEEQERAERASLPPDAPLHFQTALRGDEAVGFGQVTRASWGGPGEFRLWLRVDPAHRGVGVGRALYDGALAWARGQEAPTHLKATVRDDDPTSLGFMERRGFRQEAHTFQSVLTLADFDETPYADVLAAKEAEGLRFFNLSEAGDTEEERRKLYELNVVASRDEPTASDHFPTFEEFFRDVFSAAWFVPDGQIMVADGDHWVGIAAVGRFPGADSAFHAFTGVHPDYRGRKVALALKLLAIRQARQMGVSDIRTGNDSRNAPMLAINRKLGYVPRPGHLRLSLPLREEPEAVTEPGGAA